MEQTFSACRYACCGRRQIIGSRQGLPEAWHSIVHLATINELMLVKAAWHTVCKPRSTSDLRQHQISPSAADKLCGGLQDKISAIAEKMYGAGSVEYSEEAEKDIERYTRQGFGKLPICMAKTQYSFSGDAEKKGAPSGFTLLINRVGASVGAGFLVPLVGKPPFPASLPPFPRQILKVIAQI